MGGLIRVRETEYNWFPLVMNTFLVGISSVSILSSIAYLQERNHDQAAKFLGLAIASATVGEVMNRFSKSQIALSQAVEEANTRLAAKSIKAQEETYAADLSVASGKTLAELNIENAQINSETAVYLADLKTQEANAIAQLQEFNLEKD